MVTAYKKTFAIRASRLETSGGEKDLLHTPYRCLEGGKMSVIADRGAKPSRRAGAVY
jgi:hypothetical protein